MLPIRNISYLSPMYCGFWEKCKNSPKTGLGCSTPLNSYLIRISCNFHQIWVDFMYDSCFFKLYIFRKIAMFEKYLNNIRFSIDWLKLWFGRVVWSKCKRTYKQLNIILCAMLLWLVEFWHLLKGMWILKYVVHDVNL